MDKQLRDAMLVSQLRQKQQMKQECLRQDAETSPLHTQAEKLLALSKLADDSGEDFAFAALLQKEQHFLESLLTEMQESYDSMPAAMQASAVGNMAKNSLLMTRGALHRLQSAQKTADRKELVVCLEEAAFLLEGADGRA
jgi:hypothetical protein